MSMSRKLLLLSIVALENSQVIAMKRGSMLEEVGEECAMDLGTDPKKHMSLEIKNNSEDKILKLYERQYAPKGPYIGYKWVGYDIGKSGTINADPMNGGVFFFRTTKGPYLLSFYRDQRKVDLSTFSKNLESNEAYFQFLTDDKTPITSRITQIKEISKTRPGINKVQLMIHEDGTPEIVGH